MPCNLSQPAFRFALTWQRDPAVCVPAGAPPSVCVLQRPRAEEQRSGQHHSGQHHTRQRASQRNRPQGKLAGASASGVFIGALAKSGNGAWQCCPYTILLGQVCQPHKADLICVSTRKGPAALAGSKQGPPVAASCCVAVRAQALLGRDGSVQMLHAHPQQCAALQVTHVVSQSDVVKLLWANKQVLGGALSHTVEQLELDDVSGVDAAVDTV